MESKILSRIDAGVFVGITFYICHAGQGKPLWLKMVCVAAAYAVYRFSAWKVTKT